MNVQPPIFPTDAVIASQVGLSIGGIVFRLSGGEHLLRHEFPEHCRPFLVDTTGRDLTEAVQVRFEVSSNPDLAGVEILHSDATWSILAREGERAFVFREPASGDPLYVACFRPGSFEVAIHCSPRMFEPDEAASILRSPFRYPLDQILTMYFLGGRGFVIHSAGLAFGGSGLVFPGISGAGKSTFASLAGSRPGWVPLSDDRTVLRVDDGRPTVFGTPWPGEGRIAENRRAPAAGLFFLEKSHRNGIRPISPSECLSRLFPVVSIPWFDREVLPAALSACEEIAKTVPGAILSFRPESEAADAVEAFLGSSC